MTLREKAERAAAAAFIDGIFKYIDKNPQENLLKLMDKVWTLTGDTFPRKNRDAMMNALGDKNNAYYHLAMNMLSDVDKRILKNMILAAGLGAGVHGTREVRKNRDVYKCNIPFLILMDPTSACNLKCKGCWAAEYDKHSSLSYQEMYDIVRQGRELGTHIYMFTGGEPLMRKKDLIRLCEEFPDCAFLAYTNGTLIDDAFCDELLRVGNMTLALSIEGSEDVTDSRRGNGTYKKVLEAMEILKRKNILFGMSVCYTKDNVESVTSDEFMDSMVEKGVKFGFYFNYMPVGHNSPASLIPTPAQREHMYKWIKKTRNGETGKPMFVFDFQDDGEHVGGCIAGGRRYFHINSAGDMEPCVFIHYSDANIRTHSILEGLKSPLFTAYYKNQPFNDNHLRPCPMLENPDCLRKMVAETGARSTNPDGVETADMLCSKCDKFAAEWAPVADRLWKEYKHPNPMTQFYRDTPEGKAQAGKE